MCPHSRLDASSASACLADPSQALTLLCAHFTWVVAQEDRWSKTDAHATGDSDLRDDAFFQTMVANSFKLQEFSSLLSRMTTQGYAPDWIGYIPTIVWPTN